MMYEYKDKPIEWRKIFLIRKFIPKSNKILDLACGPGEYGPFLKQKGNFLVGLDYDKELLSIAKKNKYDKLILKKVEKTLPFKTREFDSVWCSEFLEHLPNLEIVPEIERVAHKKIIITIPNPKSPHFKDDPTHILKYTLKKLRNLFGQRKGWSYKIRGLGFDDIPAPLPIKKITTKLLWFLPEFSPTIAIIGDKK